MPTEIELHCETIEECYEFTLSYAARGVTNERESEGGRQIRHHLTRAAEAIAGLKTSGAAAIDKEGLAPREKYEAFFEVLARDAQSALAAIELVLAQPAISSQLIDNLNANIHLRALLTDLFLVTEILQLRQRQDKEVTAS
ncbi:MAG TPA: hypothetical protein VMA34_02710 [Terracidiphilus sp.]|nr:hypothetical protein [Terracidiphilus sp.]